MKKLLQIQNLQTEEFHNIKVNKYKVDYNKQWGSQQRNIAGSVRGTLVGIAANITVTTEYLSQDGIEFIGTLLNQPYFPVKFFDTLSNEVKEANYTASNVTAELIRLNNRQYKAFSFTLTAVDVWVS